MDQADYKEEKALKSCHTEFHHYPFGVDLKRGRIGTWFPSVLFAYLPVRGKEDMAPASGLHNDKLFRYNR